MLSIFQAVEIKIWKHIWSILGIEIIVQSSEILVVRKEKKIQIQSPTYQINVKKIINIPNLFDKNTKIGVSDYLSLETIDIDEDSKLELIGTQAIWLGFPFRKIYTFKTILKWEQEHWKLLEYSFIESR